MREGDSQSRRESGPPFLWGLRRSSSPRLLLAPWLVAALRSAGDGGQEFGSLHTPELLDAGRGAWMFLLILKLCESDGGVSQRVQGRQQGRTSEDPQHQQETRWDQFYAEF